MRDFKDLFDKAIDQLMRLYNCDDPIEAFVFNYMVDYDKELKKEIKKRGLDFESEIKKLEQDLKICDIDCTVNPDKAHSINKLLSMLNEHYEEEKKNEYVGE